MAVLLHICFQHHVYHQPMQSYLGRQTGKLSNAAGFVHRALLHVQKLLCLTVPQHGCGGSSTSVPVAMFRFSSMLLSCAFCDTACNQDAQHESVCTKTPFYQLTSKQNHAHTATHQYILLEGCIQTGHLCVSEMHTSAHNCYMRIGALVPAH